jgi:DedD protein
MDDALKARLIGATVLVLLAVLLIPELLSGRKAAAPATVQDAAARGTRTFTIELAGGSGGSTVTEAPAPAAPPATQAPAVGEPAGITAQQAETPAESTAETPAAESRPVPQTATDSVRVAQATDTPSAPPATVAAPPASEPDAAIAPAPVIPARGGWAVQVGAFGSEASARKLVDQLREAGYRAYIAPVSRGGKTLHRVRVGPEAARAEAESLVAGLKVRGLPATVVAND